MKFHIKLCHKVSYASRVILIFLPVETVFKKFEVLKPFEVQTQSILGNRWTLFDFK